MQSRSDRPTLLILNLFMVWPPNSGAKVVLWNRVVELSKYFRITFSCLREHASDDEGAAELARHCEVVLVDEPILPIDRRTLLRNPSAQEFSPKLDAWLESPSMKDLLERSFDLVEVHSSCWHHSALHAIQGLRVLVALNDERDYYTARAIASWRLDGVAAGLRAAVDAILVTLQERRAIAASDAVVSLAPVGAGEAKHFDGRPILHNWGGIDCEYYGTLPAPIPAARGPTLVCVSTFFIEAAVEGAATFAREVLPSLANHFPGIRLVLVGDHRGNPTMVRLSREAHVDVVGLVTDVRPYLAAADAVVVPLRRGSGVRYKIMEALAAGKAVVSTDKGAEGLGLRHGEDILLAPDTTDMTPLVDRVLGDAGFRADLERRARQTALARFDRAKEHATLARWYGKLLDERRQADGSARAKSVSTCRPSVE